MSFVGLIVSALAVWRLSHALVKEKGPLDIFIRFRAYLASKQKRSGGFFDMLSCVACTSMWVGLVAALWVAGDVFAWLSYGLAFSAIATLLEALLSSKSKKTTES